MNPRKKSPYYIGLLITLFAVAALAFPFSGGAAPDLQTKPQGTNTKARQLPNFDAFGASTKRSAAIAQSDSQAITQPQTEAGHLVQSEPRLGVPTFLWTSEPGSARSLQVNWRSVDRWQRSGVSRQESSGQIFLAIPALGSRCRHGATGVDS